MNPSMNEYHYTERSFVSMTFLSNLSFFFADLAIPTKTYILEGCFCKV